MGRQFRQLLKIITAVDHLGVNKSRNGCGTSGALTRLTFHFLPYVNGLLEADLLGEAELYYCINIESIARLRNLCD
jgi:hypothetical protein